MDFSEVFFIFLYISIDTCCERCGPHLTTTTTTTTTTEPTTTAPCLDTIPNCNELASTDGCYQFSDECCDSCRPYEIDYLPHDCR